MHVKPFLKPKDDQYWTPENECAMQILTVSNDEAFMADCKYTVVSESCFRNPVS